MKKRHVFSFPHTILSINTNIHSARISLISPDSMASRGFLYSEKQKTAIWKIRHISLVNNRSNKNYSLFLFLNKAKTDSVCLHSSLILIG
jgi:hypothetical protein